MKYATKAAFKRAMDLAREHDILVGGFELLPGGGIRIMSPVVVAGERPEDEFERLEREGRL